MIKEEILKSKIDNHKWGYSYSNIESTDGMMNDFLNIALDAMEEYANQGKWISVKDELPDHLETVWISDGKGWTTLGCRSDLYDNGDGTYNWCWAASNGIVYEENGEIFSECEEDDLYVQFWQPLPNPPKQ